MEQVYKKFGDVEIGDFIYSIHEGIKTVKSITKLKVCGKRISVGRKDIVHLYVNDEEIKNIPSKKSKTKISEVSIDERNSFFRYKKNEYLVCDIKVIETAIKNNWLEQFDSINRDIDHLKDKLNNAVNGIKNAKLSVIELELNELKSL